MSTNLALVIVNCSVLRWAHLAPGATRIRPFLNCALLRRAWFNYI
jgi:hypothetical protein